MATGTLYTTEKACALCRGPLPSGSSVNRLYCEGCRARRRIVTFLRQAHDIAVEIGDDGMVRQLDGLIRRTGVTRS